MNALRIPSHIVASRLLARASRRLAAALFFPCSRRLCAVSAGVALEPPSPSHAPSS